MLLEDSGHTAAIEWHAVVGQRRVDQPHQLLRRFKIERVGIGLKSCNQREQVFGRNFRIPIRILPQHSETLECRHRKDAFEGYLRRDHSGGASGALPSSSASLLRRMVRKPVTTFRDHARLQANSKWTSFVAWWSAELGRVSAPRARICLFAIPLPLVGRGQGWGSKGDATTWTHAIGFSTPTPCRHALRAFAARPSPQGGG